MCIYVQFHTHTCRTLRSPTISSLVICSLENSPACICVTWLIHMCNATVLHVWNDVPICVTWLNYSYDLTISYVWHQWPISGVRWLHTHDMMHSITLRCRNIQMHINLSSHVNTYFMSDIWVRHVTHVNQQYSKMHSMHDIMHSTTRNAFDIHAWHVIEYMMSHIRITCIRVTCIRMTSITGWRRVIGWMPYL